jgi:hypothetical protein
LLHALSHAGFSAAFDGMQQLYTAFSPRFLVLEPMLATGKHACKSAAHFRRPKRVQAAGLAAAIELFFLNSIGVKHRLHALALGMNVNPAWLNWIPVHRFVVAVEAGQTCLDVRARVALKRQLPLIVHASMDRLGEENGRRPQKKQSKFVFHSTFKISNTRTTIGAPASLRRNIFSCAIVACLLFLGGCNGGASQYAGIWKSHCSDYWGVQIKPSADGHYAVTFCGLSGCLPAGEWQADTPIVGDSAYEVISPDHIRIKRGDHQSLVYTRCATDTDWTPHVTDGQ